MAIKEKNYRTLVDKAEKAFQERRYLEAFLIQSCVFESVIKDYARQFLQPIFESQQDLQRKSNNFEIARWIDELFIAGKINKELYGSLNTYRKKRNQVIHQILSFKDVRAFEKELKDAYRSGLKMKVFVVEEMVKKKKGETSAELTAKLERVLGEIVPEIHKASMKELRPAMRRLFGTEMTRSLIKKSTSKSS